MSNPSSITVSLEMAEKLKEAGWPQAETYFLWTWVRGTMVVISGPDFIDPKYTRTDKTFDAPTAEEVLRRLPVTLPLDDHNHLLTVDIGGESLWELNYINSNGRAYWIDNGKTLIHTKDHSLANAAAAMWCYLAENKLLPAA